MQRHSPPVVDAVSAAAHENEDQQTLEDVPISEPRLDLPADRPLPLQPWQLDDRLRLLAGLARILDEVRRKLRALPGEGLSDIEFWARLAAG